METDKNEQAKKMAKLIAKAWSDEAFKERLIADPRAVLTAEGISVPAGVDIKVVAQTDSQRYLIIPMRPSEEAVTMLEERAAAAVRTTMCFGPTC